MIKFGIGQAVRRVEDQRFLTGQGRYVDDIALPGMCHGVNVLSPHAHARITKVDASKARAAPGALLVLTGADVAHDHLGAFTAAMMPEDLGAPKGHRIHQQLLQSDKARFVGDRIAFVALKWERGGAEFSYQKYPRDHSWSFDGGHTIAATAAPAYLGNPAHVDPEEAFVASLSSCHMLTFLAIACKQKFVLDSYEDEAVGHLEKNADGKLAITRVELSPKITWGGERKPTAEELDKMHYAAHENCFIANSVKTDVKVTKI